MHILIIGKGGREHALAWKLSQNPRIQTIYVAPGNAGCANLAKVQIIANLNKIDDLINFAKKQQITLTLVGSEELLVHGIVDKFQAHGLKIFGPNAHAASLEGSKSFAKKFMQSYGIKTAKYQSFTQYAQALKYIEDLNYPIVVKASGLAAGKGVIIAKNHDEAERALAYMLLEQAFGEAGLEVVIEEYLVGIEASVLAFTDRKSILPMLSAKDHKKIGDGDTGSNTGGMGAIAPNPYLSPQVYQDFVRDILQPTLVGIQAEKMDFAGIIFFGLMICANGVYLLEYNMRMGDPETQAILPLLDSDLLEVIEATLNKTLANITLHWKNQFSCCVVVAANGYPEHYKTGQLVHGIDEFQVADCQLFTAGVTKKGSQYLSSGGRVLNLVAIGASPEQARNKAYQALSSVSFNNNYYRHDIGI